MIMGRGSSKVKSMKSNSGASLMITFTNFNYYLFMHEGSLL